MNSRFRMHTWYGAGFRNQFLSRTYYNIYSISTLSTVTNSYRNSYCLISIYRNLQINNPYRNPHRQGQAQEHHDGRGAAAEEAEEGEGGEQEGEQGQQGGQQEWVRARRDGLKTIDFM